MPKVKVEIIVDDDRVDGVVDAIVAAAAHRQDRRRQGVGHPVDDLVRIRTGERGTDAI